MLEITTNKTPWQEALINVISDPKELLELLELDLDLLEAAKTAAKQFPLKVPRGFVNRIQKGNIHDPLLKQILPLGVELEPHTGYSQDPLQENEANPIPGLLHKYYGRVLLTLTSVCAINCRYCFRRHFPYEKNNPGTSGWNKALDYIAQDNTISEVILSGGDPLVMNDEVLKIFCGKLAAIPHLKRLRIHSRLPIVLPERITTELLDWMQQSRLKIILVVHANHAREIDEEVATVANNIKSVGITLLNQTVLLKGINDQVKTLVDLSERLFEIGIQPYYLHVLDKVQGAAHFDMNLEVAKELHRELTHQLSGFLVPKLVCEQPGAPSKTLISSRDFYTV